MNLAPGINILTTPDPLLVPYDPQSLNPHAYARNNPITLSDPTGLICNGPSSDVACPAVNGPPNATLDAPSTSSAEQPLAEPTLPSGIDEAYDNVLADGSDGRDWLRYYVEQGVPYGAIDEEVERHSQITTSFCYQYPGECVEPSKLAEAASAILTVAGAIVAPGSGGRTTAGRTSFAKPAATGAPPRFITTGAGTTIDRLRVNTSISAQRQARHAMGPGYRHGGYFKSADDAQRVLDDFHSGAADVLGTNGDFVVVRSPNVTGYNHNPRAGYLNQPTDVFFIKGSSSVSVVPANPTWTP